MNILDLQDMVVLARVGKTTRNTFEYTCFSTFSRNQEKLANIDFSKIRKLLDLAGMYYPIEIMHPRSGIQHLFVSVQYGKDNKITDVEKQIIVNQVVASGVMLELGMGNGK